MSVPMASTKNYMNELFGTLLVLSALLSTASAIDCHGKSFHCVNSTHFMICVDLGGGVSQAIDNFYIACPPPTICQGTNHFECEFPAPTTPSTIRSNVINETTLPWEEIITSSSLDNTTKEFSENYINTERATTVEYSVTTDTTVDVTTRTASNFYINNGLNVSEIAPTVVADITTSPIETISQTISEDQSITETILTTEGVTTSVIETVTDTTAETNNPTKTDRVIAGEENNKKAINMNTQTTTENIVVTETVTTESVPITTEQILQTTTDNPLEVDTSYLYTQLPQVLQNENVTNNTLLKNSSAEKNKSTNNKGKNNVPQITKVYDNEREITANFGKHKNDTVDAQNAKDTTNLDRASTIDTVGNAPKSEQQTTIYEEIFSKDSTQNTERVNLDIVITEAIPSSNVELVTTQAPLMTLSSADTPTVDKAYTTETVQKIPTSEQPTTIYEENLTKDSTQNIETVNLDIVTTEAVNILFPNSDVQLVTTQAPSLTQSSADTTTVDGAYTIETVENTPSSKDPTTIYEENFTKDTTQNIETVNLDIVTTDPINIPFSNSDGQQVTTYAPSLTQSSTDTTTLDGAYTIETVEDAPSSKDPTTIYEENFTKDTTVNIPFSNSDGQQITTYAPSLITQSFAETTTLEGAFTIEIVENAPSSEQPTIIYEENFTRDATQNIETVNLDIVTTEPINIPFSNSDGQQVTTYAPSLTQSSTDTTTLDGAYTIETVENAPSSKDPTTIYEENFIKDTTQNNETVSLDIVTTNPINIPFPNSDGQHVTTYAPSLAQSSTDTTTLDGAFTIETVENAPTSKDPTTIYEENFTKDTTQNIETVNLDIVTTDPINTPFSNSDGQQVTTYAPSLTQSSTDTTTLDGAYTIETVENAPSSKDPTTIYEENFTKDTTQNIETVNLDIVTTDPINIPFSNSDGQQVTTYAPSLTQSSTDTTTLDGAFITETIENAPSSEQAATVNEEKIIIDSTQNIETANVDIVTTEAANITITNGDDQLVMTQAPSLIQNSADTIPDRVFTIETAENNLTTEQPTTINEQSLTIDTTQNIVTENIIPNIKAINGDILTTETNYQSSTMINDQSVMAEELHVTKTTVELVTSTEQTAMLHEENWTAIIAKLPEDKLILKAELELVNVQTTNNNYANAEHDIDASQQKSKTEILGPKSESINWEKEISISDQTYNSQKGESETTPVPNRVQYSELPSIEGGQYQTSNINRNPFDNYLIDKSNKNLEPTGKSDVTNLNIERNDVNVVSSDTEFVSQKHIISAIPASNPTPAEINNLKQSYNATTVTQSSEGFLITNGLPGNIINVNSEPEVASLPTPKPITLVKEHSTHLKTNTFTRGGSATLSSSKTVPTTAKVADTTILDVTIPKLFGPISDSTVDEIGSKVKEIGSNANVSWNKKEVDNSKNNKEATAADIKILDNMHNIESIHNLFGPGSESTVDQNGSNVREIGSKAYVSSDDKEKDYPKNSEGPITVNVSKTKLHNDKIELQTNTHDLSETITKRITTEGDHKGIDEPSKPVMLNIFPLSINNVKLGPSVTNTPLLKEVTSKTQNGNIVLTTEPYQSAMFYPTLVNTPIQASVNSVHNANTPTIKDITTFDIQAEMTDKVITSKNPIFGGSTTVDNLQNRILNKNNDITTDSTLPDANLPIGVINDVSPPHPFRVGQVSKGQTNTPDNNVDSISAKEPNVNETNSPQTSNANENEAQKNNSPINLSLSITTQKPYANTVQTLSQSVTPNPISPVTKQVANEVAIPFTCVNGGRGRFSDKDDCRKFYICVGINQPVVGNCPENTVFSDIKKLCTKNLSHCIRHNEFKCPSAGRFSDFMKDNVYYICVNHKEHLYRFKFQCQSGYIFNKTTVKCIESKEIESNESVSISSSDNSSQTGSTSDSRSINNNSVSTRRTSNNSSSDDSSKTDDDSKTKYTNEVEDTREKSEGNEDDEEDEVFKCKKEGKFPIRNDCRRFYLCKKRKSEYRRKIKKCRSGRVFDKDKKRCVDADSYEC
ncbi:mucin-4-like [Cydia fagiglandana]|uniref:mucin-4-like n=1 Tax=Cydia fagiglandana TaxID=1458189 RepID=UPI002FEE3930